MSEAFNFSKHLQSIVGPNLKENGFKRKGTRFFREREGNKEEIYIQRNRFNLPGFTPFTFYINLFSHNHSLRLVYPSILEIPSYYQEYIMSSIEDRGERFKQFTQAQQHEIERYNESLEWSYSTEDELRNTLEVAREILISKGLSYFDGVSRFQIIADENERWKSIWNFGLKLNRRL
ncbi:DUF4304 domain-containing protein [Paenibacillus sp. P26]|nr:DUF4304 domain-containing protein [Paenibacillus sp. P26]UUZ95785.1 DUF4304 domain-containing protein [Paenibacillus sp. P25]